MDRRVGVRAVRSRGEAADSGWGVQAGTRLSWLPLALVGVLLSACGDPFAAQPGKGTGAASAGVPNACPYFPPDAIFNTRIDQLPVHPRSGEWVADIGPRRPFHADWGTQEDPASRAYYGIPVNVVGGAATATTWPRVNIHGAPEESDCATVSAGTVQVQQDCSGARGSQARFPFPAPSATLFEGGVCPANADCGDRHVLVVEQGSCRLWEAYQGYANAEGSLWRATSVATWDLRSNGMRPATWTSTDAAGLPIAPLLARAAEASSGEIKHGLRVTFRNAVMSRRGFDWPATHAAGSGGGIPFGAILRLKASFQIPSNWGPQARAVAVAMQRHGLYVADNGSDLFVQGEPSAQWDEAIFGQLRGIRVADFEFVDTSPIRARAGFSPRSYAVPPAP
jgi:hypothetical protein